MGSQLSLIKEIFRPWYIKAAAAVPSCAAGYQFGCDQLGFPKLPALWQMTGAYMPWWGWLIVLQFVLIFALFDYVRKRLSTSSFAQDNDSAIVVNQRLAKLELAHDARNFIEPYERLSIRNVIREDYDAFASDVEQRLTAMLDSIDRDEMRNQYGHKSEQGRRHNMEKLIGYEFPLLGLDPDETKVMVAAAIKDAGSNNSYALLQDGDGFDDPLVKTYYYVQRAPLEAMLAKLRHEKAKLVPYSGANLFHHLKQSGFKYE